MNAEDTIKALESNIQMHKEHVELGTALEKLTTNRDFNKIILEGYFEKEAIRLVHLKADPSMQSEVNQKSILRQMDSIGELKSYFMTLRHMAASAHKTIDESQADIADILSGEAV